MAAVKNKNGLTDKQEAFVLEVVKGKSQFEAYKTAYNATNMQESTIREKASRLMAQDNIGARYSQLKDKITDNAEKKAIFTVEGVLIDLKELIDRNKNIDDRVALEGLKTAAKHLGMLIDKTEGTLKLEMPNVTIGK